MLTIQGTTFASRLFLGTGKFSSTQLMRQAIQASGAEMVTVALRRVDLSKPDDDIMQNLDRLRYFFLPNTSGAINSDEAIRLARSARVGSGSNWLKLEVTPDPRTLLPDPVETLKATELLVQEGFIVLPYMNADPILALKLQDAGAAAVMPLGRRSAPTWASPPVSSWKSSSRWPRIPVVVDAGIGAPPHAALAMEIGADAVLVNTAIAVTGDPVAMATAFKLAVESGRLAYEAGLGPQSSTASASSPTLGYIEEDLAFLK